MHAVETTLHVRLADNYMYSTGAPDVKGGTVQGVVGGGASHVVMAGGNTGKINKPAKVSGLVGLL